MSRTDVYASVQQRMLDELDKGTVPWHRPWRTTWPMSMSTRRPLRGINVWLTGLTEYQSPWWGTFNKCAELCGMVKAEDDSRRGWHWASPGDEKRSVLKEDQHGTWIVGWGKTLITKKDANGEPLRDPATGRPAKMTVRLPYYHLVFNAEQCGPFLPEKYRTQEADVAGTFAEHRSAEEILDMFFGRDGAPRLVYDGNEAYWTPAGGEGEDYIQVPDLERYESPAERYSTIFHEIDHATGAKWRLNRPECVNYARTAANGDAYRPKEELCAEMGSVMLMAVAGISDEAAFKNSASYIDSWRRHLSGEPKQMVVQAAGQAQRAVDYILGHSYQDSDASEPENGDEAA